MAATPIGLYSNQFGGSYEFGFPSNIAPTINNFFARSCEFRYEAEVFAQAQEGEGHTDSVVTDRPEYRKITATLTGYIAAGFDVSQFQDSFVFPLIPGRTFIIRNIGVPRRKGEFAEVTVESESYGLIP
jgi:hypothetical protein